jgi:hypothetical protein
MPRRKVMRSIFIIASAMVLVTAPCAHAQTADMAKVTCDDLRHAYLEDLVVIGSWLSGYYNAKRNNTIVDLKQLGLNTQRVLQFCQINPEVPVMQAVDQVASARH